MHQTEANTSRILRSSGAIFLAFSIGATLACAGEVSPTLSAFAAPRNAGLPPLALDFTSATVVATPSFGPETKAIEVLVEEVEQRTLACWPVVRQAEGVAGATVIVGTFAQVRPLLAAIKTKVPLQEPSVAAEGYQIATVSDRAAGGAPLVVIAGKDARGVLFGIGHFLRKLHFGPARAGLMAPLDVVTSPRYPLRGHQLGYRNIPNSYSGWDAAQWDRYIRELALFGANSVELIPPRNDNPQDSPHFPEPPLDMMRNMSRICADYGLDVWVWLPQLEKDYGKPETVQHELDESAVVFRALPRIDAVFVPGGDPGDTPPELLFPLLEKQTANLRRFHPHATMWVSPQKFSPKHMDETFAFLATNQPDWLEGLVFGPLVNMDLSEFRRRTPARYKVRHYPDITHIFSAQNPVPDLDLAHALTIGREPICPRPEDMTRIVRLLQPYTDGAITYSEGCTDDVNKMLWSQLQWDPELSPLEILRDYGRFFVSERLGDDFARGLVALEQNWRGSILLNAGIDTTLSQFRDMERAATPADLHNWRFLMALYRAYYDAYIRQRAVYENGLEIEALSVLRTAERQGALAAIDQADTILNRASTRPVGQDERTRVFQLAEALFQTIQMKLSVPLYRATSQRRGANLDAIDWALNNGPWLKRQFAEIRALDDESSRLAAIGQIIDWTNPGPGGFYDDLGNPALQPHLVVGQGYETDPQFIHTVMATHTIINRDPATTGQRTSWLTHAGGVGPAAKLRYTDLDPQARYEVTFATADDQSRTPIVLRADGGPELWRTRARGNSNGKTEIVTLDIPPEATADGVLELSWAQLPGKGDNGRGLVAEVWLLKKP